MSTELEHAPLGAHDATGRERALDAARHHFESGAFAASLAQRVSVRTESQSADHAPMLFDYLRDEIAPYLSRMDFACALHANPVEGAPPFLLATRIEDDALPTVLLYAHGDVVRGDASNWEPGRDPWSMQRDGARFYGRGTADNKGQHTVNLAALDIVLRARGRLGFNVKLVMEMGEEVGSPGLAQFAALHRDALSADVFIASDGPRIDAATPTLFLGSRGFINFTLEVRCRERSFHSGNWGGLLTNPAIRLAHAAATLTDARGAIHLPALKPAALPDDVKRKLADIALNGSPGDPHIDDAWGEPGLSRAEKLYGWNTLEILAMTAGNPAAPVNAIPPAARMHCQLRFVVDTAWERIESALREHFDRHGFDDVEIVIGDHSPATRLSSDNAWVALASQSIDATLGRAPAILPNIGGSIPNHVFADILGLPTVWIPHSYPGCAQHAPNEHMLENIAREGLLMMTGLWWDIAGRA